MSIQNLVRIETHNNRVIELLQVGTEYCIDSRIVAKGLDIQHEYFKETLVKYQARLERWGILRFQTGEIKGRGQPEKYALLNRNQVLFAITLSKNTEEVLDWKEAIIDALDQLEKQVAQQKQLTAPKKRGHPRKIKYERRNKPPIHDPEYQRAEIIRTFERVNIPLSPAQLAGCYLKSLDTTTTHIRCDELVAAGKLKKICSRHSPRGRYQLV